MRPAKNFCYQLLISKKALEIAFAMETTTKDAVEPHQLQAIKLGRTATTKGKTKTEQKPEKYRNTQFMPFRFIDI